MKNPGKRDGDPCWEIHQVMGGRDGAGKVGTQTQDRMDSEPDNGGEAMPGWANSSSWKYFQKSLQSK